MKHKIALLLALLLLVTPVLTACGGNTDPGVTLPDGMQLGYAGDGYTFYAPVRWQVSEAGGVPTAMVSSVDRTSLTCVRIESDKSAAAYFSESEAELTARLFEYTLTNEGSDSLTLGGVAAIRRVYTAKVEGTAYKFMQVLCQKDGYIYLLTYTAENTAKENETSKFDTHYEDATAAISAFAFSGTGKPPVTTAGPTEVLPGMYEASDPAVSRYSLYAPLSWTTVTATGITTVKKGEEAVLSVSYEVPREDNIPALWEARKTSYTAIYENFTVIEAECETAEVEKLEDVKVFFGEVPAVRYVYTYTVNGTAYKSAEILTIRGVYIYTMTYTAKADAYAAGMADFDAMRTSFVFR